MEGLLGRTNGDLINNGLCRQERRPTGMAFEDLGSVLFKSVQVNETRDKPKNIPPFTGYAASDSDDEMDLLSQPEDWEQQPTNKKKTGPSSKDHVIDPNGVAHEFHPKYRPTNVLKSLKFKKNKKEAVTQPEASSSNILPLKENGRCDPFGKGPDNTREGLTRRGDGEDIYSTEWDAEVSGKGKNVLRETSSNPRTRTSSQNDTGNTTKKPSLGRPIPRPVKPRTTSQAKMRNSADERDAQSKPLHPKRAVLATKPVADLARTRVRKNKPSKAKDVESDLFPASPHSEIEDTFSDESSKPKGKKSQAHRSAANLKKSDTVISDFPMPSPQSSPAPRELSSQGPSSSLRRSDTVVEAFPMPSPQSSKVWGDPRKSRKARRSPDVEVLTRERSPPRIRPFPMSTQLSGLDSNDTPTTRPFRPGKRGSDYDSDGHDSKRRRDNSLLRNSPGDTDAYDEDDSIFISSTVDPRTLCPYCDSLLPSSPSQYFQRLLIDISKKSRPDPRPANPLGRKAPMGTFIAACQRHRFESHILPEAERKGWPKTIDWKKLVGRVEQLKDALQALINDPGEHSSVEDDDDHDGPGGPRSKCVFWHEVMKEVKMKGSRAAAGVRGQFANFEKAQPGYYGELGSVIIYQTLFNLFPPSSFDPTLIEPLTVIEFTQRVLVPEVAVRLIMEDMRLQGDNGMKTAIRTLRESSIYGATMFPDDPGDRKAGASNKQDGEDEELGVGDRIVMERARKRRKELEEEEDREEEEEKQLQKPPERSVGLKDKGKGKQRERDPVEPPIPVVVKSRPRPRPVTKSSSSTNVLNAVADIDVDLQTRHTMGTKNIYDTDPGTDDEIEVLFGKFRRSPSASETTPSKRRPLRITSSQNIPQSFSTRNSGSDMDIYSTTDDRDTDNDPSIVPKKDRGRKQAGKATKKSAKKAYSEPSTDEVEIVPTKTPLAKRPSRSITISDEETPKPTRTVFESTTPPLERARKRGAKKSTQETPWSHSLRSDLDYSPASRRQNDYGWLLSDSSRDSLDKR